MLQRRQGDRGIASPSVAGRTAACDPEAAAEEQGAGYGCAAQRRRGQPCSRGGRSAGPGVRGPCRASSWRGASRCSRYSWRGRRGRGRARGFRRDGGRRRRAERGGLELGPAVAGHHDRGEQAARAAGEGQFLADLEEAGTGRRGRQRRQPGWADGRTVAGHGDAGPVVPQAVTGASVDGAQQPHAAR